MARFGQQISDAPTRRARRNPFADAPIRMGADGGMIQREEVRTPPPSVVGTPSQIDNQSPKPDVQTGELILNKFEDKIGNANEIIDQFSKRYVYDPLDKFQTVLDNADDVQIEMTKWRELEVKQAISLHLNKWYKDTGKSGVQTDKNIFETNMKVYQFGKEHYGVLPELKKKIADIKSYRDNLGSHSFESSVSDISKAFENEFILYRAETLEKINDKIADLSGKIKSHLQNEINLRNNHNESVKKSVEDYNKTYEQLKVKQQLLMVHEDKVTNMMATYHVSAYDLNTDFTEDQLSQLYDKFTAILDRDFVKANPITAFRTLVPNVIAQGVILLIFLLLSFTPLLAIFSIFFIGYLIHSSFKQKDMLKVYMVAYALMYNVDFNSFIKDVDDSELQNANIDWSAIETVPEVVTLKEELEKTIEEYNQIKTRFEAEYGMLINVLGQKTPEIQEYINTWIVDSENRKKYITEALKKTQLNIQRYQWFLEEYKPSLNFNYSRQFVFNTKFIMGYDQEGNVLRYDIGSNSQIFKTAGSSPEEVGEFIRLMFMNAIIAVAPGLLDIIVYDPNNRARDLAYFICEGTESIVTLCNDNFSELVNTLKQHGDANFRILQGRTITEYNTEQENNNGKPLKYKLLFILSQPGTVEDDEALMSALTYSSDLGTIIWVVSDNIASVPNVKVWDRPFRIGGRI